MVSSDTPWCRLTPIPLCGVTFYFWCRSTSTRRQQTQIDEKKQKHKINEIQPINDQIHKTIMNTIRTQPTNHFSSKLQAYGYALTSKINKKWGKIMEAAKNDERHFDLTPKLRFSPQKRIFSSLELYFRKLCQNRRLSSF